DSFELEEAVQVVRTSDAASPSAEELRALARRLPAHARRRFVSDDSIAALPAQGSAPDAEVEGLEDERAARQAGASLRTALAALDAQDRLILRLRFADALQIAEIAAALRLEPKSLYKRVERLLGRLRDALTKAGVDGARVLELLGRPTTDLAAGLSRGENRDV